MEERLSSRQYSSPVGELRLVASDRGLAAILWPNDRATRIRLAPTKFDEQHPILVETAAQLDQYFARNRRSFDVPLDFRGTDFQCRVWRALVEIPYGETRTYMQLAVQLGSPGASRAIGAANGRNPISIVAPCHRVVGTSGALTGFAGGLEVKRQLLEFEGRRAGMEMAQKCFRY